MNKKEKRSEKNAALSPLPVATVLLEAHANPIWNALTQWREQKKVPPVLLLSGPRGCGKRDIAFHLVQTLQCENAGFSDASEEEDGSSLFGDSPTGRAAEYTGVPAPCGTCASCLRALSGHSLDFKEIGLEGDANTLKIDQFREMKETLGFSSYSGSYRIFLITDAEKMTVQAANSLLKILEEPPVGWLFILTVSDPTLLPSTVVSRCQILRLRPLPEKALRELLSKYDVPADRVDLLASLGEGSIARALELGAEDAWEMRGVLFRFLAQPQSVFHTLIDYAAADQKNFRLLIDQFEQVLNDLVLHVDAPSADYRNLDAHKILEDHALRCVKKKGSSREALAFWIDRSERLFRLRREMTAPLNQKVLIQDFLAPWMDAV